MSTTTTITDAQAQELVHRHCGGRGRITVSRVTELVNRGYRYVDRLTLLRLVISQYMRKVVIVVGSFSDPHLIHTPTLKSLNTTDVLFS